MNRETLEQTLRNNSDLPTDDLIEYTKRIIEMERTQPVTRIFWYLEDCMKLYKLEQHELWHNVDVVKEYESALIRGLYE